MSELAAVDAILAVDIGNTRIGLTICDDDGPRGTRRVLVAAPEQWREAIFDVWSEADRSRSRAVVVASVNPRITAAFCEALEEVCEQTPLRVRDDLPLPMKVLFEGADEVGVDRVCAAAAAFDRLQSACAVASFGTAITIDCVSAEGEFLGGTILPGLEMSCEALHENTAGLPRISPVKPDGTFGTSTETAINNGVLFGAVGALRDIVERFATELGAWPPLVITGGNAPLIRDLADFVDAIEPDLCLRGVALAYRQAVDGRVNDH